MKKNDVFRLPQQRYFLTIEDWQVAFCGGDRCTAAMLDFFSNRHGHYLDRLEATKEKNKVLKTNEVVDPYMVQTVAKIAEYTLGMFGRNKIIDSIQELVSKGVLLEKKDTQNNKSYFLQTKPVQDFIDFKWLPFLGTLGKDENPLKKYLSQIGYSQAKRPVGSLILNDENGSLITNKGSLILNDETAFGSLISDEAGLILNDNKVVISSNDSLVVISKTTTPNGGGCISESDIEDFEMQLKAEQSEAQKAPHVPPAPPFCQSCETDITELLETLNSMANRCYTVTGARAKANRDILMKLLKQKYTREEINAVIQTKCFEWGNNIKMSKFLRPETLFGSKFHSYLEEYNNLKSNPHFAEQFKKNINATKPANSAYDNAVQIAESVARLRAEGY
jgi:uncharacterized phage protein (TIGR02220 family)